MLKTPLYTNESQVELNYITSLFHNFYPPGAEAGVFGENKANNIVAVMYYFHPTGTEAKIFCVN